MPARNNLVGCIFGRWTVVDYHGSSGQGAMWNCVCDCGTKKPVHAASLTSGRSLSCGCWQRENLSLSRARHGHNRRTTGQSPTYKTWRSMLKRCNDPKQTGYKNYGGKGIKVCEAWKSFDAFLADMGERPEGKTLDRIDGDGDYTKENCRWMDMREQANNRNNNHLITHNGETHTVAEWARILGIPDGTIRARLFRGLSDEDALAT